MMKKTLTLLAVAMIPAMMSGCAACCPPGLCGGLCPCCPFFNRPAAPACPPTYAPVAACPPAAPPCVAWDPCQCAVVTRGTGGLPAPPAFAQAPQGQALPMMQQAPQMTLPFMQSPQALAHTQPQAFAPQPMMFSEPSCGYVETSCGFPGAVGYGPSMPIDYGYSDGGCCPSTAGGTPMPEPAVE